MICILEKQPSVCVSWLKMLSFVLLFVQPLLADDVESTSAETLHETIYSLWNSGIEDGEFTAKFTLSSGISLDRDAAAKGAFLESGAKPEIESGVLIKSGSLVRLTVDRPARQVSTTSPPGTRFEGKVYAGLAFDATTNGIVDLDYNRPSNTPLNSVFASRRPDALIASYLPSGAASGVLTPLNLYRNASNHPLLLYVFGATGSIAAVYSSGTKEDVNFVTITANGDYPQTKTYEYRTVGDAIVLLRIIHEVIVAGTVKTTEVLCENHHIDGTLAFPLTVKHLMMDSAQTPPVVALSLWHAEEFSVVPPTRSAFGLELDKHTTVFGLKPEGMRRALNEGRVLNVGDLTASDLQFQDAPMPE